MATYDLIGENPNDNPNIPSTVKANIYTGTQVKSLTNIKSETDVKNILRAGMDAEFKGIDVVGFVKELATGVFMALADLARGAVELGKDIVGGAAGAFFGVIKGGFDAIAGGMSWLSNKVLSALGFGHSETPPPPVEMASPFVAAIEDTINPLLLRTNEALKGMADNAAELLLAREAQQQLTQDVEAAHGVAVGAVNDLASARLALSDSIAEALGVAEDATAKAETIATNLETTRELINSAVSDAMKRANLAVSMADENIAAIEGINAQLGDLSAEAGALTEEQKNIAGNISNILGDITSITSDVDTVSGEVATLAGSLNTAMTHISAANEKASEIERRLETSGDVGKKITDLVADLTAKTGPTSALQTGINQLQTNLDNISVGGRNLILNSTIPSAVTSTGAGITSALGGGLLKVTAAAINSNFLSLSSGMPLAPGTSLTAGEPVTFSVEVRSPDSTSVPNFYFGPGAGYRRMAGGVSSQWSRIYLSAAWTATTWSPHFGFSSAIGTFEFRNFKLERGNKPTDWTPAPEDAVSQIGEAKTLANQGISDAANAKSAVDNVRVGGRNFLLKSGDAKMPLTIRSNNNASYPIRTGVDEIGEWVNGNFNTTPNEMFLSTYFWETFVAGVASGAYSQGLATLSGPLTVSAEFMTPEHAINVRIGNTGRGVMLQPGTWVRVSSTSDMSAITRPPAITVNSGSGVPSDAKIYHRKWKIEAGNIATDWTPAVEDVDAGIGAAMLEASTARTEVGVKATEVTNLAFGEAKAKADEARRLAEDAAKRLADLAQGNAVSAAAADAQAKADKALEDAQSTASQLAIQAQAAAELTAAADAQAKANQALADAQAKATELANSAKAAAITAAAADAKTKADSAKNTAISTAAADAKTKADSAKNTAISTAAADAKAKADQAQAAAELTAAADAKTKADKALADAQVKAAELANSAQAAAISAAATDAQTRADKALTDAQSTASQLATQAQAAAELTAAADAQAKASQALIDAQAKAAELANSAQAAAIATAAADAKTKADSAKSAAISTAAADAKTKADNAKSAAITAAAADAKAKADQALVNAQAKAKELADQAESNALVAAAADAKAKADKAYADAQDKAAELADGARVAAETAAAADAKAKADKALVDAQSTASQLATQAQAAAELTAAADAQAKASQALADAQAKAQELADSAKAAAITAAAADAKTKADSAKNTAISTAAADAKTKADNAKSAAISAAATDAKTKADQAQAAAELTAAADAKAKADKAYSDAQAKAKELADAAQAAAESTAKTELGNLQIGGRNLARRVNYSGTSSHQTIIKTNEVFWTGEPIYHGVKISTGTPPTTFYGFNDDWTMAPGETFTFSVWVKGANLPKGMNANFLFYDVPNRKSVKAVSAVGDGEEWQLLQGTYTNTTGEPIPSMRLYFYLNRNPDEETYFTSPKMERGSKATDWSPAPEDVDDTIVKAQTAATTTAAADAKARADQARIDAETKAKQLADQAQATAELTAAADAQAKADKALSDAQAKAKELADQAQANALIAAATDAQAKASQALVDAQAKAQEFADSAKAAAISAAATDAKTKADSAKSAAISAAAADAKTKADSAKAAAISAAAADAKTKADSAKSAAISAAASDAKTKADQAQAAAELTAAADAKAKADKALEDAKANAQQVATQAQAAAELTAAADAQAKANQALIDAQAKAQEFADSAKAAAITAAATDAKTKADSAKAAAISAAATDAKTKADSAKNAAISAAAIDAKAKADQAQAAAELTAAADAKAKADKAYSDAQAKAKELADAAQAAAESTAKTALGNLQIGGRNLVIRTGELRGWLDGSGNHTNTSGHFVMRDHISVTPGETLTFTKQGTGYFRWNWYDAEQNYIDRKADSRNEFQWVVPSDVYSIWVSYQEGSFPQIERGNKATDWTPAPEDVDDTIVKAQTAAITAAATDAKTKADQAQAAAELTAAADAKAKADKALVDAQAKAAELANSAKAAAITAAAADAKTKADSAKAAAITAAAADAKTKADSAKAAAITAAATDAKTKADQAQAAAELTAAADAQAKANQALIDAQTKAQELADSAKSAAISAAATDAKTKADSAKAAAISAAAADAKTKADNAKTAAISAAATDAQTKATKAQTDAEAKAKTLADQAQAAAELTAAADAKAKADKALVDAQAKATELANGAKTAAISTAAADAKTKADKALADAQSTASQLAIQAQAAAELTAAADAQAKADKAYSDAQVKAKALADAAQAAAISTAAADAKTKADSAKTAAVSTAAADAKAKADKAYSDAQTKATELANSAKASAISTAAADAKTKADQAQAAAELTAAADAKAKADKALEDAQAKAQELANGAQMAAEATAQNALNNLSISGRNLLKDSTTIAIDGSDYRTVVTTSYANGVSRLDVVSADNPHWNMHKFIQSRVLDKDFFFNGGAEYVISADFRTFLQNGGQTEFRIDVRDTAGRVVAYWQAPINSVNSQWVRVSVPIVIPVRAEGDTALDRILVQPRRVGSISTNGDWLEVKNLKLERGNKATDWTPAPEDVDDTISKAQSAAISTAAADAKAKADSAKTAAISTAAADAKAKADSAKTAAITAAAADAKTKADQAQAAAELTAAVDAKAKADKALTDAQAKAKELADAAQAAAESTAKTELGNLQIGGRNLLRNSGGDYLKLDSATYSPSLVTEDGKRAIAWNSSNNIIHFGRRGAPTLYSGDWVTFSFLAKATVPMSLGRIYVGTGAGNSAHLSGTVVTEEWKRYSFSYQVTTETTPNFHMYPKLLNEDGTYETFFLTDLKLEYGNKATDWTPAPEDVDNTITNAQSTAIATAAADAKAKADQAQAAAELTAAADAKAKADKAYADAQTKAAELANNAQAAAISTAAADAKTKADKAYSDAQTKATELANSAKAAAITAAATDAKTKADSAKAAAISAAAIDAKTKADQAQAAAELTAAADAKAKADKALSDAQAKAKELADSAQAAAESTAKTALGNLQIGGRNLVRNSSFVVNKLETLPNRGEYTAFVVEGPYNDLQTGDEVTLSFDLELIINDLSWPRLQVYNSNRLGPVQFPMVTVPFSVSEPGETVRQRVKITRTVTRRDEPTAVLSAIEFYTWYGTGNHYKITNLKVERGNKATDWTPAPEDVDDTIVKAQTAAITAAAADAKTLADQAQAAAEVTAAADAKAKADKALADAQAKAAELANSAQAAAISTAATDAKTKADNAKSAAITAAAADAKTKADKAYSDAQAKAAELATAAQNAAQTKASDDLAGYKNLTDPKVNKALEDASKGISDAAAVNSKLATTNSNLTGVKATADAARAAQKREDTRTIERPPHYYWTKGEVAYSEFTRMATINLSDPRFAGSTYCFLETKVPWTDSSGGPILQTVDFGNYQKGTIWKRYSIGTRESAYWSAWTNELAELHDSTSSLNSRLGTLTADQQATLSKAESGLAQANLALDRLTTNDQRGQSLIRTVPGTSTPEWANLNGMILDTVIEKPAGYTGDVFTRPLGAGSPARTSDNVKVMPGSSYAYSIWVKADKPNSRLYIELRDQVGLLAAKTNHSEHTTSSYILGDVDVPTVWTKYSGVIDLRDDVTSVYIARWFFNHSNGTERNAVVSIADFQIEPYVPTKAMVDKIQNDILANHQEFQLDQVKWNKTQEIVNANQAGWNATQQIVNDNYAAWIDAQSTVNKYQAAWNDTQKIVNDSQAGWNATQQIVNENQAKWNDAQKIVNDNQAGWNAVQKIVNDNQAAWNNAQQVINANQAKWNDAQKIVNDNHAKWADAVTNAVSALDKAQATHDSLWGTQGELNRINNVLWDAQSGWNKVQETLWADQGKLNKTFIQAESAMQEAQRSTALLFAEQDGWNQTQSKLNDTFKAMFDENGRINALQARTDDNQNEAIRANTAALRLAFPHSDMVPSMANGNPWWTSGMVASSTYRPTGETGKSFSRAGKVSYLTNASSDAFIPLVKGITLRVSFWATKVSAGTGGAFFEMLNKAGVSIISRWRKTGTSTWTVGTSFGELLPDTLVASTTNGKWQFFEYEIELDANATYALPWLYANPAGTGVQTRFYGLKITSVMPLQEQVDKSQNEAITALTRATAMAFPDINSLKNDGWAGSTTKVTNAGAPTGFSGAVYRAVGDMGSLLTAGNGFMTPANGIDLRISFWVKIPSVASFSVDVVNSAGTSLMKSYRKTLPDRAKTWTTTSAGISGNFSDVASTAGGATESWSLHRFAVKVTEGYDQEMFIKASFGSSSIPVHVAGMHVSAYFPGQDEVDAAQNDAISSIHKSLEGLDRIGALEQKQSTDLEEIGTSITTVQEELRDAMPRMLYCYTSTSNDVVTYDADKKFWKVTIPRNGTRATLEGLNGWVGTFMGTIFYKNGTVFPLTSGSMPRGDGSVTFQTESTSNQIREIHVFYQVAPRKQNGVTKSNQTVYTAPEDVWQSVTNVTHQPPKKVESFTANIEVTWNNATFGDTYGVRLVRWRAGVTTVIKEFTQTGLGPRTPWESGVRTQRLFVTSPSIDGGTILRVEVFSTGDNPSQREYRDVKATMKWTEDI